MSYFYFKKRICLYTLSIMLSACTPVSSNSDAPELNQKTLSMETDFLSLAQNNCASWQAIKLTSGEKILLDELTKREVYSYKSLDSVNTQKTTIYIKTVDNTFLRDEAVIHDSSDKVELNRYYLSDNKFKKELMSYETVGIFDENFDANIYRDIKQNIEKIDINNLDDLMNDPYAQYVLKLDKLGMHELFYLIGDETISQSYDAKSERRLSFSDLANGLLMIIYGQDFWNNKVFPAPIDRIYDLKFEQLIAHPEWYSLSIDEKNKAFLNDDYIRFISRGWHMSVSDMSFLDSNSAIKDYGRQTPEWIESVLANYPDDSQPHKFENYVSNPINHQADTLKSLKFKLISALENAENVLATCDSDG